MTALKLIGDNPVTACAWACQCSSNNCYSCANGFGITAGFASTFEEGAIQGVLRRFVLKAVVVLIF